MTRPCDGLVGAPGRRDEGVGHCQKVRSKDARCRFHDPLFTLIPGPGRGENPKYPWTTRAEGTYIRLASGNHGVGLLALHQRRRIEQGATEMRSDLPFTARALTGAVAAIVLLTVGIALAASL